MHDIQLPFKLVPLPPLLPWQTLLFSSLLRYASSSNNSMFDMTNDPRARPCSSSGIFHLGSFMQARSYHRMPFNRVYLSALLTIFFFFLLLRLNARNSMERIKMQQMQQGQNALFSEQPASFSSVDPSGGVSHPAPNLNKSENAYDREQGHPLQMKISREVFYS
jgi:hypothetical protein